MRARLLPLLLAPLALMLPVAPASAEEAADAEGGLALPAPEEVEADFPEGAELSGRELYERYIEGRNKESFQRLRILSRDPGGSAQLSRFALYLQDNRDENGDAVRGVRARMRIDVDDPFDMRHTKYLIITKEDGPDDEFVYQPSARRVRRVDLRATNFLGTDFTFDDIMFQNVEDADYRRLPDERIDGTPVYVVEARAKEGADGDYHRSLLYLEKEHYVPLRARYWDELDVAVKEMTAPVSSIREFDGAWVATESTMRDLRQHTSSTLYIDELDPAPDFNPATFSVHRLARGK